MESYALLTRMPYYHGDELAAAYADARDGGYGFFASNVVQFDIAVGLLRGATDNRDAMFAGDLERRLRGERPEHVVEVE